MEWGVLETVTAVVLVAVVPTFGPLIECFGTAGAAAPSRSGWSSSPSSCSPSGPTRLMAMLGLLFGEGGE